MTRVPSRTASKSILDAMEANYGRLVNTQRQIASGKRITKMSDAPADALSVNALRNSEKRAGAYVTAAEDGLSMLQTQDSTLQNVSTILARVRELSLSASTDIESANGRVAIATELEGLRDQLVGLANTTHAGRAVFGGFSAAAVQSTGGSVSFVGDTNPIERRVSPDLKLAVSTNGREVFGFDAGSPAGSDNVFAVINRIVSSVRAGSSAGARAELTNVDGRIRDVTNALASVGGRVAQLDVVKTQTEDAIVSMRSRRSTLEDTDVGAAVIDLKDAQSAYEATLAVVAQLHRTSLLDFLR